MQVANLLLARKLKEYSLMLASFRVLFWPYVFAALPRILVSAFTFILPQLMKRILQQIQKSDAPLYIQNTLIMATALLFACVAVGPSQRAGALRLLIVIE